MAELKDGPRLGAEERIRLARTVAVQAATDSGSIQPAAPLPSNVVPFPLGNDRAARVPAWTPKRLHGSRPETSREPQSALPAKAQHRTRTDDPFLTMDRGPADERARDASRGTEKPGPDGKPA